MHQDVYNQMDRVTHFSKDVEKLKPICFADENVKWCSRLESSLAVLQNLNADLPCDPATALLGTYPRGMKIYVHTKVVQKIFIVVIQESKGGNNPNVHPLING